MCNINLLYKKNKRRSTQLLNCINVVTYNSFLKNDDGEGYFNETHTVHKSVNKHIYKTPSYMLVTHQRIATSGKVAKMNQPLENSKFIIVHNGIFRSLGSTEKSDTYEYLQKLTKNYRNSDSTVKAIQKTNKNVGGYYSIVLYNKETGELLYYKDTGAQMYILNGKKYLGMSTVKDNVEYMQQYLDEKGDIQQVDANTIFDINNNFEKIDTFEPYVDKSITFFKSGKSYDTYVRPLPNKYNQSYDYAFDNEDDLGFGQDYWFKKPKRQKNCYGNQVLELLRKDLEKFFAYISIEHYKIGFTGDGVRISLFNKPDLIMVESWFLEIVKKVPSRGDKFLVMIKQKDLLEVLFHIFEKHDL